MNCSDCAKWSGYGCEEFEIDTGEIEHYCIDAELRCKRFEEKIVKSSIREGCKARDESWLTEVGPVY